MKLFLWVVFGFIVAGLAFFLIASVWSPTNPLVQDLIVVLFMLPSVGAFWMMYSAIRHEKQPLRFILLAFIPFAFIWYYFEHVRSGKHLQRQVT